MRIFLDTNILIEYFERRAHYLPVSKIFEAIEDEEIEAVMSVGGLYTITFLLTKALKREGIHRPEQTEQLRLILNNVIELVQTGDLSPQGVWNAVNDTRFTDIEDSYQFQCAIENECDALITINTKDYRKDSPLPILLPEEFIPILNNKAQ